MDENEIVNDYPVMFSQPGTDEAGTPEGAELLMAIASIEPREDGYAYAAFGPKTRENLQSLVDTLQASRNALAFARSVIQSGESWSSTCDEMIGGAINALS